MGISSQTVETFGTKSVLDQRLHIFSVHHVVLFSIAEKMHIYLKIYALTMKFKMIYIRHIQADSMDYTTQANFKGLLISFHT